MKKRKNRTLKITGHTIRNLSPSAMSEVAGATETTAFSCNFSACLGGCGGSGQHTPASEYPANED